MCVCVLINATHQSVQWRHVVDRCSLCWRAIVVRWLLSADSVRAGYRAGEPEEDVWKWLSLGLGCPVRGHPKSFARRVRVRAHRHVAAGTPRVARSRVYHPPSLPYQSCTDPTESPRYGRSYPAADHPTAATSLLNTWMWQYRYRSREIDNIQQPIPSIGRTVFDCAKSTRVTSWNQQFHGFGVPTVRFAVGVELGVYTLREDGPHTNRSDQGLISIIDVDKIYVLVFYILNHIAPLQDELLMPKSLNIFLNTGYSARVVVLKFRSK